MTYIENVFICIAIPLILSMLFTRGRARSFTVFVTIGMTVSLLSAYVSGFFMSALGADAVISAIEITPVSEEVMKLLPTLFWFLIYEPDIRKLPDVAIGIAVGFATFENVCFLAENGAEDIRFVLIRGISAGALHILCGIMTGFGLSVVFRQRWLALTGTVGILGFCIGFHAIYNLLITAEGAWRVTGYLLPSVMIVVLGVVGRFAPRLEERFANGR